MRRLALALSLLATPLAAEEISFADGWTIQPFGLFGNNRYTLGEDGLTMESDDAVSLVWYRVPEALWGATQAEWTWEVTSSVEATDLTVKGGDDRNFTMYFFFLPEEEARAFGDGNIRDLQGNESGRVLTYVWGGDYETGEVIPSPYLGERGAAVMLQSVGTGEYTESVDLAADFGRAFEGDRGALVGIAVSGDSDDTGGVIEGMIRGLSVE